MRPQQNARPPLPIAQLCWLPAKAATYRGPELLPSVARVPTVANGSMHPMKAIATTSDPTRSEPTRSDLVRSAPARRKVHRRVGVRSRSAGLRSFTITSGGTACRAIERSSPGHARPTSSRAISEIPSSRHARGTTQARTQANAAWEVPQVGVAGESAPESVGPLPTAWTPAPICSSRIMNVTRAMMV